jgi:hypothetical protein
LNRNNRNTGHYRLLAAVLLFTIIIRGVPLINSGLPYGYDGFYHTYKVYNILETASINYNLYLPPTLNVFVAVFALLSSVDILSIVRFIPVLTSVLVVLSLYLLVRDMFRHREDASVIAAAAASIFSVNEFYLFYSSTYLAESLALITVLIFIYTISHRYWYLSFFMLFATAAFHHVLSLLLLLSLIAGVFLSGWTGQRRYYLSMAVFFSFSIALFWRGLYWEGVQYFSAGPWSSSISTYFLDVIIKFKWVLVVSIVLLPLIIFSLYRIPRAPGYGYIFGYVKKGLDERTVFVLAFLSMVAAIAALPVVSAYLHITTSRAFLPLLLNHLGAILTISLGAAGMVVVYRELNRQSRFMFYWLIATAVLVLWDVAGAGKVISLTRMLVYLTIPLSVFAGRYLTGVFAGTPSKVFLAAVVLLVVIVVPANILSAYPDRDMAYKSGLNYQYVEQQEYVSSLWIAGHIPEDRVFAADIRTGGVIRGIGHNIVPNGYFYRIMAPEDFGYRDTWSIENVSGEGRVYRVNALEDFSSIFKGNTSWRDYVFEVMVRIEDYNRSNSRATAGLMFRSDMAKGNLYYLSIYPGVDGDGGVGGAGTGVCKLYTYNRYVARLLDMRPCSIEKGVWYKLKVKVNGSGISYYLDGRELGRIDSYSHRMGNVGIGATGAFAYFDNVSVSMSNGTLLLEDGFESGSTAGWEMMQWDVMTLIENVTYKSRDGRRREGMDYIYVSNLMQMPGAILITDPGGNLMRSVPLSNRSLLKWESPGFNRVYGNGMVRIYGVVP